MNLQIALMLGTIVAAVALFSWDRIPTDATALGVLLFLILARLLPTERAFAGFGSDVVVMMLGLLILMAALSETGVTEYAARALLRRTEPSPNQLLLMVMLAAVTLGAFMSNTAATAFFLPIVVGSARRIKVSVSRLLMPLAFASILASSITLIGTSTNVIVSGLMTDYGLSPMGMFELAPVGLPIALIGLAYMSLLGRHLVPDRIPQEQVQDLSVRLYLSEIVLQPVSTLIGKTLEESGFGRDFDLTVLRIARDTGRTIVPRANSRLKEGDVLLVEGARENILQVKEVDGLGIKPEVELAAPSAEEIDLTEVIVGPGSPVIGRTLRGLRFREQYGLQVLAINRHGERLRQKMSRLRLRMGDVLIVQGNQRQIENLERQDIFRILEPIEETLLHRERGPLSLAIFAGVLVATALNLLPLPVATLLGALLVFVTRCITPEEAYHRVNWSVLILIASMLGLGAAMEATGTAEFLSSLVLRVVGRTQPIWLLTAFFALTVLLTQPMSNQSAAVVVLPVAIGTATQLGLNPRPFAMMVALGASCSFLTPLEPACLLVYGPGRYKAVDFLKVGSLLTLLIYLICIVGVPTVWPL